MVAIVVLSVEPNLKVKTESNMFFLDSLGNFSNFIAGCFQNTSLVTASNSHMFLDWATVVVVGIVLKVAACDHRCSH